MLDTLPKAEIGARTVARLKPQRLLSIGEFSAATQLTPKALRLYDEQDLLRPASVDSANGYRSYRADQVSTGRLIRTLREMGLSLSQIAEVISLEHQQGELVLRQFSQELDCRYAQEKRAYHSALLMMRNARATTSPAIEELQSESQVVSVWGFACDRTAFVGRYFAEYELALQRLNPLGVTLGGQATCLLLDPLTDEEGRLELLVPVLAPRATALPGISLRRIPARHYARITPNRGAHAMEFTGALDALFDWFDRHSYHAVDWPLVSLVRAEGRVSALVSWAFEPGRS